MVHREASKEIEPNSCAWHIYIIYSLSLSIPLSLSLYRSLVFSDDAVVSACPRFTFGHSAPIELPDFSQQGGPRRISKFSCHVIWSTSVPGGSDVWA